MTPLIPCISSGVMKAASDVWHERALGRSAESIWRTLLAKGELTPGNLADYTGRGVRTVQRALDKLSMYGLVTPVGGGYWSAEPVSTEDLVEIAGLYGTLGKGDQRIMRFKKERASRASELMHKTKINWHQKHQNIRLTRDGFCAVCVNHKERIGSGGRDEV